MQRLSSSEDADFIPKCSICFTVMNNNVIITHCGHRFCQDCITRCIDQDHKCPSCRTRLCRNQLIKDREFPEIVQKMIEMHHHSLQPAGSGDNNTNMTQIVSPDSPLWDQYVEHTDKLLVFKGKEISRLKVRVETSNTENHQLKEEVEQLKTNIVSLPNLKERIKQLERQMTAKQTEIVTLKERIQKDGGTIASLKASVDMFKKAKAAHDKTESTLYAEVQKKADRLGHLTKENERLTKENTQLECDVEQEQNQIEKLCKENETLKTQLNSAKEEVQGLNVELKKTQDQALLLWNRMNQLEMYEKNCSEKDQVLQEMYEITLPQRDQTIISSQTKVAQLEDELAKIQRDTVPIGFHTSKIQSEVQKTKDNLQQSYEAARDANITFIEEERKLWHQRLKSVESQLKSQSEMGELSTVTPTYKRLLKENTDLQDKVKCLKQSLRNNQIRLSGEGDSVLYGRDN